MNTTLENMVDNNQYIIDVSYNGYCDNELLVKIENELYFAPMNFDNGIYIIENEVGLNKVGIDYLIQFYTDNKAEFDYYFELENIGYTLYDLYNIVIYAMAIDSKTSFTQIQVDINFFGIIKG